ncbi:hypothetical protein K0M31_003383 [Melipona bicolor]|uniref:Uncharacterized protein n=1 Tax=Melipona bicolor TaxID=60889 RepID=A0AA40FZ40_9HYME|nr:hypothetical protein K0M31_003383 [Melipona bicolor]
MAFVRSSNEEEEEVEEKIRRGKDSRPVEGEKQRGGKRKCPGAKEGEGEGIESESNPRTIQQDTSEHGDTRKFDMTMVLGRWPDSCRPVDTDLNINLGPSTGRARIMWLGQPQVRRKDRLRYPLHSVNREPPPFLDLLSQSANSLSRDREPPINPCEMKHKHGQLVEQLRCLRTRSQGVMYRTRYLQS